VARATLDFVLRELTGPESGFLSAIDAETHGHEGAYYTWTKDELRELLPPEDHALLASVYGFGGDPNFEGDRYVLHLPRRLDEAARDLGLTGEELARRLERERQALLRARDRRPRPLVDDKVLTDWNGLMIGAMARAGEQLGERRYVEAAGRAAEFVLSRLREPGTGALLHVWREGEARIPAFLDDYAFLVEGLLRLHASTGEERWLAEAARLAAEQERRLGDGEEGGYFAAGEDPRLLFRAKPAYDGAAASGNGTAVLNLLELEHLTGKAEHGLRAEAALRAFAEGISRLPLAHVTLVRALARLREAVPAPVADRVAAREEPLDDLAREVVEVDGRLGAGPGPWRAFVLDLTVREGWHVNANPAGLASLVATSLSPVLGELRGVRYPAGEPFGPASSRVPVYRGRVRLEGEVQPPDVGAPSLELSYQACDDTRCLPPVTRLVRLK
jgi:uncharacterized protein YyaL (SSP411 family)